MDVLSSAAYLGRAEEIKIILEVTASDVDILKKDKDFRTSLHYAVISGNIKAVQPIVFTCAKYRLNIDICDKHGLTPYIYARKLGYHDIAELLVTVGGASTSKSDSKSFKSADEWAVEGVRERIRHARIQMRRERKIKLIGGQLIKPVQSKAIPTIVITTEHKKSYVVDLNKSKNFMGHSLKEFDDKLAHGLKPWEQVTDAEAILHTSHGASHTSALSLLKLNDSTRDEPVNELSSPSNNNINGKDNKRMKSHQINYFMTILSEQSTDAFRKSVKLPDPPKSVASSPECKSEESKVSSLATLLNKEEKSERSSSRKNFAKAMKSDALPTKASSKIIRVKSASKKRIKKGKVAFLPPIGSQLKTSGS